MCSALYVSRWTLYDDVSSIYDDLTTILHLIGWCWQSYYFPMQNVLKIRFRISSAVVAPVMASSGRKAL